MRLKFNEVFRTNPDGSISPIGIVRIGSLVVGPGITLKPGESFRGFDVGTLRGEELEATREGSVTVIIAPRDTA